MWILLRSKLKRIGATLESLYLPGYFEQNLKWLASNRLAVIYIIVKQKFDDTPDQSGIYSFHDIHLDGIENREI